MNTEQLSAMRHTLAHLLAAAVKELYPNALPTIGPAIDTGFYYDFDFVGDEKPGDRDLQRVEQKMKELLKKWEEIVGEEVTEERARENFASNPFKLELIDEIVSRGESLTLYHSGSVGCVAHAEQRSFTDLCRGGHSENPAKEIPSGCFKLERIAGAYWRGSEKNPMLTRIYGLAFESKDALAAFETQMEEAKKRDHKKLGRELDLFTFSDLVGAGLPLWTPKGTLVRNLLDDFVWSLRAAQGYERVEIPHITKKDLYVTSGHWEKYQDDLFKIITREGHEFAMKPMNCPHHTQIYARRLWSYKELPQRYANTTTCYRDEQSGELSGLSRVRAFAQDDAHVFCRMVDAKTEFLKIWDIIHSFYPVFGFTLQVRLSRHDPATPEQYLGDATRWEFAESMLQEIIEEKGVSAIDGLGEAAFYGPKLDFMAHDSIGRQWQVATIQLDLNMPERFDLVCINEKGERERVVMIHAAIMGSIERFLSIVIEHVAGAFPTWLAPEQVVVVPVAEKHHAYALEVAKILVQSGIRARFDGANVSMGKKIRESKQQKVPYILVVGDKEVADGLVTVESRDRGNEGALLLVDFIEQVVKEVKTRGV
ncbi:MAG: threonine--tRNA ligase [Candidatus Pacebacteria bacterium]|nr:threonine--tRNA ligase [Candidatus Paceibacterota bacterium]